MGGPKQLIYTRGWRGSTRGNARQVHTVARPWQNPLWFSRILLPHLDRDVFYVVLSAEFHPQYKAYTVSIILVYTSTVVYTSTRAHCTSTLSTLGTMQPSPEQPHYNLPM